MVASRLTALANVNAYVLVECAAKREALYRE